MRPGPGFHPLQKHFKRGGTFGLLPKPRKALEFQRSCRRPELARPLDMYPGRVTIPSRAPEPWHHGMNTALFTRATEAALQGLHSSEVPRRRWLPGLADYCGHCHCEPGPPPHPATPFGKEALALQSTASPTISTARVLCPGETERDPKQALTPCYQAPPMNGPMQGRGQ